MLNLDDLPHYAARTGFAPSALEKVLRLAEVLEVLRAGATLAPSLVLKGGTALNLCFGPPTRLSVDLDFNFVGAEERSAMLAMRPGLERDLQTRLQELGYRVQRSREEHAGRKFFAAYSNHEGSPDRIQIDIAYLQRVCLLPQECRATWHPSGNPGPLTNIVSVAELAAGKILAFLDRCAPRDAWDVARLPWIWGPEGPPTVFKRLLVGVSGTLDHPLGSYGPKRLERLTATAVKTQLWPMLTTGERPSAETIRSAAWAVVGPFLQLDAAEREFVDRLQAGAFLPELLFPNDQGMVERLRRYPPLLWKLENVRGQAGGRKKPGGRFGDVS